MRPDITLCEQCGQILFRPYEATLEKLLSEFIDILRVQLIFLLYTSDDGLVYFGYSDSDWAGDLDNRRSILVLEFV